MAIIGTCSDCPPASANLGVTVAFAMFGLAVAIDFILVSSGSGMREGAATNSLSIRAAAW